MANPYELWQTRQLLGVFRDSRPENWYFGQFFTNAMRSTSEWIDFEKLPIRSRELAPFVKPMGRGEGVFTDKVTGYRFKPANVVVEDAVDPLRPLTYQPGIDASTVQPSQLTPMQRLALIKLNMMNEMQLAVERRWEWMRARAVIDAAVTCTYKDGTSVVVDFQRAPGQTEVLGSGSRWGDSGVSVLGHIQNIMDTVNNAAFGGLIDRITMGGGVASVVRQNDEILAHMDLTIKGGVHTVDRGLASTDKIYKFGELFVGGASGHRIELWVNNETYTVKGTQTRYLANNAIIATASPQSINGYECYGMIVDKDAEYQALPMFPKNFETGERVKVENLSIESAPIFVPINPNATYKATVLA
ncbi:hypothetical protein AEAC466_04220 [Asticcacaulis sp. AC466]|uniref:major capsid protein n=1 Tax=Asticcacaulis sp. AC466 TaxID=1282362 RepID=UPI0003C3E3B6|nr:major capsid protein [Asticcacaulis sp. AC466]ESQ85505.1 hypothetical protein AEAC466_04220 [Asticcacaulis sp. AC466]